MPKTIRVGTFNCENLFMRYWLLDGKKEKDSDKPAMPDEHAEAKEKPVSAAEFEKKGNINMLGWTLDDVNVVDENQRRFTAMVLRNPKNDPAGPALPEPDIVAVQEIENLIALKQFNGKFLARKYPHVLSIDCNDPRQIDVGILSKYPIVHVRSYQADRDASGVVFSRDCLEVDVLVDPASGRRLTLFINHLKSQLNSPGTTDNGQAKRLRQAKRVREIVEARFPGLQGDFVILGDMNAGPGTPELQPLYGDGKLENVVARLPAGERWTHQYRKATEQLDHIILSPALAKRSKGKPHIERRGLSKKMTAYAGPRFKGIAEEGTEASDHCAVFMDVVV